LTAIKVKKVNWIQQFVEITSPLWEITCHMGSRSVTCHPAAVGDFHAFTATKAGTRVSNARGIQG